MRTFILTKQIQKLQILTFEVARKYGNEAKSLQSDPLFKDAENGDFTLLPNSPAFDLGFRPFKLNAGIQR